MAKESMKARERKRQRIVAKYAAKRKSLKDANDYVGLQPKGYIRQFGLSRVMFREMANKGLIPGVTKASW